VILFPLKIFSTLTVTIEKYEAKAFVKILEKNSIAHNNIMPSKYFIHFSSKKNIIISAIDLNFVFLFNFHN